MKKSLLMLSSLAVLPLMTACATVEEAVAEATADTHRATLTGTEIVGSRGDPDGYARAELTVSDEASQVCYDLNNLRGLGPITGITIHRGARGMTGTTVMRLKPANEGGWKDCVGRAEWLEDSLEKRPGAYYIQVATSDFPSGAIRGQFMR